jgi:hypothetical protein
VARILDVTAGLRLLNVAVGGNFPGPPNAGTVFPVTMDVDYVRVYSGNP